MTSGAWTTGCAQSRDRLQESRSAPRYARRLALFLTIGIAVACGDDSPAPTGPTQVPPRPATPTVVAERFDDRFWRELVYNAHDKPGDLAGRVLWVLPTASPNVYIRTTNLESADVAYMRREIPRIVHQVTGETYTGRVEDGPADVERPGWILIRTVTRGTAPEFITGTSCGYARIGADPGADLDREGLRLPAVSDTASRARARARALPRRRCRCRDAPGLVGHQLLAGGAAPRRAGVSGWPRRRLLRKPEHVRRQQVVRRGTSGTRIRRRLRGAPRPRGGRLADAAAVPRPAPAPIDPDRASAHGTARPTRASDLPRRAAAAGRTWE